MPGTEEGLALVTTSFAGDEPYEGWLEDSRGKVWARLDAFRFSFVNFSDVTAEERSSLDQNGPTQARVPEGTYISSFSDRLRWSGKLFELDDYLKGFDDGDPDAAVAFTSTASKVELVLNAHGWSGLARVQVNGDEFCRVDLYNEENNISKRVYIDNPDNLSLDVRITAVGKNPNSQGSQVLLDGIVEYGKVLVTPTYSKLKARNRGGSFRPRFFEFSRQLHADAVILDVGGGRRQLADPRYINLEYSAFDEPDIFGDGTALPFKAGTVDFVYSSAVLEHVTDPLRMGREIHRVLKPGGSALADAAFMQPIHSEGQHFFNVTPYGMELIFNMFRDRKIWWETGFANTMRWFASATQLKKFADNNKVEQFLALANEFSALIPEERGMYVAAGVCFEGTK
ncbi:class I SAM-dependent methyltransferase [Sphingomonas sp. KRR8]|uniref:methyltransferase domain-containing protein n=1 Tax=Sphingomonas sp. KRR8 TaxID=2942996 RepID=UPI0020202F05|nr:class I SAM-dependent methyltransferase [Sphingomonas sp. KRR8]URD60982.1 class I SAM-dependent methyltransferase [Sphingomonas sp. KRR8]